MTFYGQFDTDRYIANYFPHNYIGTCVDVGMADAIAGSNTYHFEHKGWNCLCVEPNPKYVAMAKGIRSHVVNVACGDHNEDDVDFEIVTINGSNQSAISSLHIDERLIASHQHMINSVEKIKINLRTLDTVLAENPWVTNIDFVSVDTENTELSVLKGFDIKRWAPKLIVVENNFDESFVADYLKDFEYKRHRRSGVNDFFVPV